MALKSIIDIEVNDEAFKAFQANFGEFQKKLKEANGGAGVIGDKFDRLSDLMEMIAYNTAQSAKSQGQMERATNNTNQAMSTLVRNTRDVSKGILEATGSLLKWTGIIASIGMFGGLFGINRMAQGVMNRQNAAGGLTSATSGSAWAFQNTFGQSFNAQGIMQSVSAAQGTYGAPGLAKIGVNPTGQTPDIAVAVMRSFMDFLAKHPGAKNQMAKAFGYGEFLSNEDMNRIRNNPKAFMSLIPEYQGMKKTGELAESTARTWGKFERQTGAAGVQIENAFATALLPLAPALTDLSKAIVAATKTLLGSDAFKGAIDELSKGIRTFSSYLTSPDFRADMADVMDGLADFARTLKKFAGATFGPDDRERMERSGKRFGFQPYAFTQALNDTGFLARDGYNIKNPKAGNALVDAFAANANQIGASIHDRASLHNVIAGIVSGLPGLNQAQRAEATQKIELRLFVPAGMDASVTANGMVPAR